MHPVHPSYGPCDALGEGEICSVCLEIILDLQQAPLRLLDQIAVLRKQLDEACGQPVERSDHATTSQDGKR